MDEFLINTPLTDLSLENFTRVLSYPTSATDRNSYAKGLFRQQLRKMVSREFPFDDIDQPRVDYAGKLIKGMAREAKAKITNKRTRFIVPPPYVSEDNELNDALEYDDTKPYKRQKTSTPEIHLDIVEEREKTTPAIASNTDEQHRETAPDFLSFLLMSSSNEDLPSTVVVDDSEDQNFPNTPTSNNMVISTAAHASSAPEPEQTEQSEQSAAQIAAITAAEKLICHAITKICDDTSARVGVIERIVNTGLKFLQRHVQPQPELEEPL